jgi:alanine racemase
MAIIAIVVCLSAIGNAKVAIGDKAILWGDEKLRVETVAHHSGTIAYELLTGVSARVGFVSGK